MTGHSVRDHAAWSASASERLWACPGSYVLTKDAPRRESEPAAWGTACHQVAEKALRGGFDPVKLIGTIEETGLRPFEVDDEMAECAAVFVDYVREQANAPGNTLLVEQKFDLGALKPPMPAGGTGDAVILHRAAGLIEIVDLKTGRGKFVGEHENKQLRTYALGAALANPGPWTAVRATIVQPRLGREAVRSETIHITELMDWTVDLKEAWARAERAEECDVPEEFVDFLSPGEHCTFCDARPTCPALRKTAMEKAHTYFTATREPVKLAQPPEPAALPMDKLVAVLDAADMIDNWLNAVRAYAREQAEAGVEIAAGDSRYVLVPKQARRKWKDESVAIQALREAGLDDDDIWNAPKIRTPAQAEKALPKAKRGMIEVLAAAESSGLNLVRADKTTRAAETPPALKFFSKE